MQEVCNEVKLNISTQSEVLDKVCRNDRISFDGKLLCYKPVFTIKSKEDLLETLKQQQDMAGIDFAELKEAYPKIEETVAVWNHISSFDLIFCRN